MRAKLRAFRLVGLSLSVAGALMIALAAYLWSVQSDSPGVRAQTDGAVAVLNAMNVRRAQHGLAPLALDSRLTLAAQTHSDYMVSHNCFSHQCSGEADPRTRIAQVGYPCCATGETIGVGYPDAAAVVTGWYNSPAHRNIMLDPAARGLGVGFARCASGCAYGTYWTGTYGTVANGISELPAVGPTPTRPAMRHRTNLPIVSGEGQ